MCARRPRRALAAALLLALLVLPAVSAQPARAAIATGAFVPGVDLHPARLAHFGREVGRQPAVASIYKDWGNPVFEQHQLDAFWRRGAVTMVTLEPWHASLKAIAKGRYDRYVKTAARSAVSWGRPVLLRFAHEMNGDWYPWGKQTSARVYKAAWRHLVRVFRRAGARNVRWVWTPYVDPGWNLPFASRYPGDRWVDWVGLDGINWGGGPSGWHSFKQLFVPSYRTLSRVSRAPMIIGEVGCGERGGSKARWVTTALRSTLPRMRRVRAIVWWSARDPRGDLRVDSSRAALSALRRAVRAGLYRSPRNFLSGPLRGFRLGS